MRDCRAAGLGASDVTVRTNDDAGWDHYADKWIVEGPDGAVYGERVLAHPHENEQPFTPVAAGYPYSRKTYRP